MRGPDSERAPPEEECWKLIEEGHYIDANATLETAFSAFERTAKPYLPVVSLSAVDKPPDLLGALYHVDALRAYNRALAATAAEEHS